MIRKNLGVLVLGVLALMLLLPSTARAEEGQGPAWLEASDPAGAGAAPDEALFAPAPTVRSCYSACLFEQIPIMCGGLSGAELQQCANDVAEGCRCMCGLYCP